MGFRSFDEILSAQTNGQALRVDWGRVVVSAGTGNLGSYVLQLQQGSNGYAGGAATWTDGTNLSFQTLCDGKTAALYHGGDVTPLSKHISQMTVRSNGVGPGQACLFNVCDFLGYIPVSTITTTGDQAIINSATFSASYVTSEITHVGYDIADCSRVRLTTTVALPEPFQTDTDYWTIRTSSTTSKLASSRANAAAGIWVNVITGGTGTHTVTVGLPRYTDGIGVQAFFVVTSTTGAGTPNLRLTYTDAFLGAGQLTPGTLPAAVAAKPVGCISYSDSTAAAGRYNPYFPLAAKGKGIVKVEQWNQSATMTSGTGAIVLCRPLATIAMGSSGFNHEKDFINVFPPMPRIYDGAYLGFIHSNGSGNALAAGVHINGNFQFVWG